MMRIKYNLITKNKDISPVQMSVTWDGNRIQKNIGHSVETKYWDKNRHRLKSSHTNALTFNAYLHELETAIISKYNEKLDFNKSVSKNVIKKELVNIINNGVSEDLKNQNLIDVFNLFIEKYRPNGKKPAKKTIDSYINTRNKIIRYMKHTKQSLSFDDIDVDFINSFIDYLRQEKENSDNTIGTNITKIKTFMKWTHQRKYHNNDEYQKFKTLKNEALFSMALTEEEVKTLYNLKVDNKEMEFSRLFMVVNCHIGLRYSDLMDVIKNHTVNSNKISKFQVKTRKRVSLYINDDMIDKINRLKELYEDRYNRKVINRNLKKIGQLCGMNQIETSTKLVGNDRYTIEKPRWELLTTHVGRRTFATTAANNKMPLHSIKKYTGHSSLDSLEKYLNASNYDDKEVLENLFNIN
ncbi:MAG: tyrosine-type recombinase/integrase [Chlorobiota bacterium]